MIEFKNSVYIVSIPSVIFSWHGLPAYAARLLAAIPSDISVIATKPSVPIKGMELILPKRIQWIEENYGDGWCGLNLKIPEIYFQPSWSTPAFNKLGEEVRSAGGKVIVMFDNRWRGDFRQILGALRFRTQWRNRFAAAWVAGCSGKRLAQFFGFSPNKIYEGMYGADPTVFAAQVSIPLRTRPKRIIFVGRIVEQKGVRELIAAWSNFLKKNQGWELHIYGTGHLEAEVRRAPVRFHAFQQPETIAEGMRNARFLVLPSHEEHWGLVVCEAAQAGCGLLLSTAVGSHYDLLGEKNGCLFAPSSVGALGRALEWAAKKSDEQLDEVQAESWNKGSVFTPHSWAMTFGKILFDLSKT